MRSWPLPDARLSRRIHYLAGQALAVAGDGPGAIDRWRAATTEAPENHFAYLALVEIVNRDADFDLFQRGYIDLFAEAYDPAIGAFQGYLAAVDATDSRQQPRATGWASPIWVQAATTKPLPSWTK